MIDKKKLRKILAGLDHITEQEKKILLEELRNDIDLLDRNIASQLSDRVKLVFLIGKLKKKLGIQTYSCKREKEILENVTSTFKGTKLQKSIEKIYIKVIEESRLIQHSDIDLSFLFEDKNKLGDVN